jgi:hypothetical protein
MEGYLGMGFLGAAFRATPGGGRTSAATDEDRARYAARDRSRAVGPSAATPRGGKDQSEAAKYQRHLDRQRRRGRSGGWLDRITGLFSKGRELAEGEREAEAEAPSAGGETPWAWWLGGAVVVAAGVGLALRARAQR